VISKVNRLKTHPTPHDIQMQALHDVVQAGYARYIGMSSCYAYQCARQPVL
jgi:aryl-alcohol dehydrogenase-like predicted oxidoreductase